jgi:hypothetical protein
MVSSVLMDRSALIFMMQPKENFSFWSAEPLKMKALKSFETSGITRQLTRHYILEDLHLHSYPQTEMISEFGFSA